METMSPDQGGGCLRDRRLVTASAGLTLSRSDSTSGVLVDICCELKGLEEVEKTNGRPQRAGKVVLQIALTPLAKCPGLSSERRRRGMRHWCEDDYRPSIDGCRGARLSPPIKTPSAMPPSARPRRLSGCAAPWP